MDKKAIIAAIQANPAVSKNYADNIFVPMTAEQKEYMRKRERPAFNPQLGERARFVAA